MRSCKYAIAALGITRLLIQRRITFCMSPDDMSLCINPSPTKNSTGDFAPGAGRANRFLKMLAIGIGIVLGLLNVSAPVALGQVHNNKPLELSGLSISQAYDIQDDQPLDLGDPMILQLVYRIQKTSTKSRSVYSEYSKDLTWEQLSSQTQDYRLWVVDRKARLKKITKHRFADAERDDLVKGIFVCHCENQHQQPVVVLSRTVPRSLPIDTDLDEPIALNGFLFARREVGSKTGVVPEKSDDDSGASQTELKEGDDAGLSSALVFIVDRIAWYPDQVDQPHSNQSHVALAQAGVDIGLLDFVRENNAQKLGNADSEAFYQMIGSVNRLEPNIAFDHRIGFVDIMRDGASNFGNAVRIKGVVRSCSEVSVTDSDVASRIGVSKYYQLIVFPNLDGGKIVVKNKSGEDIEYKRFPITVCCLQLPEGFSTTSIERQSFLIDGFFFRFWKYQSDKTDAAGASGQVSQLIIVKTPIHVAAEEGWLDLILLCFVTVLIVGFSILTWWYRGVDRRQKSPGQKIIESLPEQIDVAGIEEGIQ